MKLDCDSIKLKACALSPDGMEIGIEDIFYIDCPALLYRYIIRFYKLDIFVNVFWIALVYHKYRLNIR